MAAMAATIASFLAACAGTLDDPSAFNQDLQFPIDDGTDGGGPGGGDGGVVNCAAATTAIFVPTCGRVGCHSGANPQAGLDLVSPMLAARLINHPAYGDPTKLLIDSANPDDSALLTKLGSSFPFGSQMPFLSAPLPTREVLCVRNWIRFQLVSLDGGAAPALDAGLLPTSTHLLDAARD